jgi:glycosyltransferase involved in cell wall biosynthesis
LILCRFWGNYIASRDVIHFTNKISLTKSASLENFPTSTSIMFHNCHSPQAKRASIKFSIVTPSFRQVAHLRRCAASIADQVGDFEVEHLVQDAQSGVDFLEWAQNQDFSDWVSEADHGMYDAINRGFKRATGDIIAWLNCDEQYLPGALQQVATYFHNHPEVDILIGDVVLIDESMHPLAYRRSVLPSAGHIRYSHLSNFTAATFVRRRIIDDGLWLDTRWKTISDAVWMDSMLTAGYRAAVLPKPLALFSMLGSNLGQSTKLFYERTEWEQSLNCTNRWMRLYYICCFRIAKFLAGAYFLRRVSVAGYTEDVSQRRQTSCWLGGFWSHAKSHVDKQRLRDECRFSERPIKKELSSPLAYFFSAIALGLAFLSDMITTGESVKAPLVMIFAMLMLTLRAKTRDLVCISVLFFFCSAYSLRFRPPDIAIVRLLTFIITAILAYTSSTILRDLEKWMGVTVGLIRRIPQPIILTNRKGAVVLVNVAAESLLEQNESEFIGTNLSLIIEGVGINRMDCSINTWEDRPPTSKISLNPFIKGKAPKAITANVFMVGTGKRRLFGFSLQVDE